VGKQPASAAGGEVVRVEENPARFEIKVHSDNSSGILPVDGKWGRGLKKEVKWG
jgi:hypothetical protein